MYMILKKMYKVGELNVVIYEVEEGLNKKYIVGLLNKYNLWIWGTGETDYEALVNASETWSNNLVGLNPFKYALQHFP